MKKLYIDLSCDKVSGQQIMQRQLKKFCIKRGIYTDKDKADALVYVQIPFDATIKAEWQKYKCAGKKIIFIHHYFDRFRYQKYALFKDPELFNLIDLHFVTGMDSDIAIDCINSPGKIYIYEQGGVDQQRLIGNYFTGFNKKQKRSICFVGRESKGLNEFIKYTSTERFVGWKKYVFCPERIMANELDSSYKPFVGLTDDELYSHLARQQYIYFDADWKIPAKHLEMCLQEAICCGVIVLLGQQIRQHFHKPFLDECFPEFNQFSDPEMLQQAQLTFLQREYQTADDICHRNVETIQNFFDHH